ncbi:hypothetical protein C8J56DRAFT_150995 [Mycena floridula]|nr:hypothetical protein C8J56DRAFT_150995 [Mycena floridula]
MSKSSKKYTFGSRFVRYLRNPTREAEESLDDALEQLSKYDTVFIVDDSLSMRGSRWREAKVALTDLVEKAKGYDADGVDIHFLNSSEMERGVKETKLVDEVFAKVEPNGVTPIGGRLKQLLDIYLETLEELKETNEHNTLKRINFLIITDGQPTDEPKDVIVAAARRLEAGHFSLAQVGIQFVQVGHDRDAQKYLKGLDDGLTEKYKIRDMVDTFPYCEALTGAKLVKILVGGINRRLDKMDTIHK